jgi:hypothetical protein
MKLFGGFVHSVDNNTMVALTGYSGINVQRGLSPIKLEKNCAAAINSYFPERFSIKQILADNAKSFLDFGAIERRPIIHFYWLSCRLVSARYLFDALDVSPQ